MATKITKSELKQMIREALREALNKINGIRIITIWDGDESDKLIQDFATFEEAAKHYDDVYVNAVEDDYAEEVLYPVLDAMNNKEYDYIDDDGYAVYEQRVSTSVFEALRKSKSVKNTKSELKEMIREALREELLHEVQVPVRKVALSTVYIVFNCGASNDLDNYYLHAACLNRNEAINSFIEEADYRIKNYNALDNTLYCCEVTLADYDITLDELKQAANSKYSGGVDLHWEHTDVVYALSNIAKNATPVFELSMADIWADYYIAYLASTGYDIDTIDETDVYAVQDITSDLAEDDAFEKFIINKLRTEIK